MILYSLGIPDDLLLQILNKNSVAIEIFVIKLLFDIDLQIVIYKRNYPLNWVYRYDSIIKYGTTLS